MGEEGRRFTRTNRGARMSILLSEAREADISGKTEVRGGDVSLGEVTKGALQGTQITYNDYFNESSDEGSYVESSEEEDSVDSDFVTDEEEEEDDEEAEADVKNAEKAEKRKSKNKSAYLDPAKRQRLAKAAAATDDSDSDANNKSTPGGRDRSRRRSTSDAAPGDRRSYRQSTAQRSEASKSAAKEEEKRKQESSKKRPVQEERRLTQEELLAMAKETAVENAKDLERLVRIEEDLMRVDWYRAPVVGPRIVYVSKKESDYLIFTEPEASMVAEWESDESPEVPKKALCVITGLPAKYRDPKTLQPYATIEAFKKIRERDDKGK